MTTIPLKTVNAYVDRYPSLRTLATNMSAGNKRAELDFARNCLRLEVPLGVTVRDVWVLSSFAEPRQ